MYIDRLFVPFSLYVYMAASRLGFSAQDWTQGFVHVRQVFCD